MDFKRAGRKAREVLVVAAVPRTIGVRNDLLRAADFHVVEAGGRVKHEVLLDLQITSDVAEAFEPE
jgi:hypothetical protein